MSFLTRGGREGVPERELAFEELPYLYREAENFGLSRSRSTAWIRKLGKDTVAQYKELLKAGHFEAADPERVKKYHGGTMYYYTGILPAWLRYGPKKK